MKYEPFTASVDAKLIRNASSFFDNSLGSIVRELLQNSRRSGATEVSLQQAGDRWRYIDNGEGCDPNELLGLGTSRWGVDVEESETPAGCGFFSLARRNPTVTCRSRGWGMDLTDATFNGEVPATPVEVTTSPDTPGLEIYFAGASNDYLSDVKKIAQYMPLVFTLDGEPQESGVDFMTPTAGVLYGEEWNITPFIRARVEVIRGYGRRGVSASYHGHVLTIPNQNQDHFGAKGGDLSIRTRLEVTRESALPLELPQRNRVIASDYLTAILANVNNTALRMVAENLEDELYASPQVWVDARTQSGYLGKIALSPIYGFVQLRAEDLGMTDYQVFEQEDDTIVNGRAITFDEFEEEGFRIAPNDDNKLLTLIAQTDALDADGDLTYDPDLEMAPGLKIADPLHRYSAVSDALADEGPREKAWMERMRRLSSRTNETWCEDVRVCSVGPDPEDATEDIHNEDDVDSFDLSDRTVTKLWLEFYDDEGESFLKLPAAALFELPGDSYDTDVSFVATKKWLDEMPSGHVGDLTRAVYLIRKLNDYEDGERVDVFAEVAGKLETSFSRLQGDIEETVRSRILNAVSSRVATALYELPETMEAVITVSRYGSDTVELRPEYKAAYRFEGLNGGFSCDKLGNRQSTADDRCYPEYHSIDVATMLQAGLKGVDHDILDTPGWHDSTKRIYVSPEIHHTLWSIGLLDEPAPEYGGAETAQALGVAIHNGLISDVLFTAWSREHPTTVVASLDSYAELARKTGTARPIPNMMDIWIYDEPTA